MASCETSAGDTRWSATHLLSEPPSTPSSLHNPPKVGPAALRFHVSLTQVGLPPTLDMPAHRGCQVTCKADLVITCGPIPRLPSQESTPGQSLHRPLAGEPLSHQALGGLCASHACSLVHRAGTYLESLTSRTATQWAKQSVTTAAAIIEGHGRSYRNSVYNRYLLDLDKTVGSAPSPQRY